MKSLRGTTEPSGKSSLTGGACSVASRKERSSGTAFSQAGLGLQGRSAKGANYPSALGLIHSTSPSNFSELWVA